MCSRLLRLWVIIGPGHLITEGIQASVQMQAIVRTTGQSEKKLGAVSSVPSEHTVRTSLPRQEEEEEEERCA